MEAQTIITICYLVANVILLIFGLWWLYGSNKMFWNGFNSQYKNAQFTPNEILVLSLVLEKHLKTLDPNSAEFEDRKRLLNKIEREDKKIMTW